MSWQSHTEDENRTIASQGEKAHASLYEEVTNKLFSEGAAKRDAPLCCQEYGKKAASRAKAKAASRLTSAPRNAAPLEEQLKGILLDAAKSTDKKLNHGPKPR